MRKRITTIIAVVMVVAGAFLLLYPTVSDKLTRGVSSRTISSYVAAVEPIEDDHYAELLEAARAYNERLAEKGGFELALPENELAEYNSLLDIDNTGVMGYVSVPKVDIVLPIYHGTGDDALQSGVGHLEGSSFPVGGPGTHAVLSAHTGLPSAKLFTNIDRLVEGDDFTVRVLRETLTYEVDQILVVLPHETEALEIVPGEDYCTLLTCTPYGVNSHRLLVRGRRVPGETPAEEEVSAGTAAVTVIETPEPPPEPENAGLPEPGAERRLVVIAVLAFALVLMIPLRWRQARKRK